MRSVPDVILGESFVCGHGLAKRVEREVARGAGQPREDRLPQPLAPGGAEALEVAAGELGTEMRSRERPYVMSSSTFAYIIHGCVEYRVTNQDG